MENDNEKEEEIISLNKRRAEVFYSRNTIVHVSLKNGTFYNGRIMAIGFDFFEIHDREDGMKLVFFQELKHPITEYVEREEDNGKVLEL